MKPGDQDSGILVVPQVTTFAADAVVLAVSTWRSDRGVRSGVCENGTTRAPSGNEETMTIPRLSRPWAQALASPEDARRPRRHFEVEPAIESRNPITSRICAGVSCRFGIRTCGYADASCFAMGSPLFSI